MPAHFSVGSVICATAERNSQREISVILCVTLAENGKLSAADDLTRVATRRFFGKHFPREVERAARHGRALSLILCDIDLFKSINDSLVHAGGGQVLKQFGARLHSCAKASPSLPAPACAGPDRVPAASELPCTLAFASAAVGENALSTTQALAWPGVCGRRAPSVHMVMHKFCG